TATIGRHAGPGCASLTRATRLTGATRLHVARIRPKAASGSHADPLRRGRRGLPEHRPRGRTQGTPRLARSPAPGCASLTRATRLPGDAAPRSPDKAEGRIRVAHGSVATRAQGPARTLPQGARTGTATIGPPAGPRGASPTPATRPTRAPRRRVARVPPEAPPARAHGP